MLREPSECREICRACRRARAMPRKEGKSSKNAKAARNQNESLTLRKGDQKFCAIPLEPCCGKTFGLSILVFRLAGLSRITASWLWPPYALSYGPVWP